MPTTSFLIDRVVDHYAAAGHRSGDDFPAAAPVLFACPFCDEHGTDPEWLREHLRTVHPLAAPQLLVGGWPCRSEATFREPIPDAALSVANVSRIDLRLNRDRFVDIPLEELRSRLRDFESGVATVSLANERPGVAAALREYVLRVALPDEAGLDEVDAAFIAVGSATADTPRLDAFGRRVESLSNVAAYAGALYGYLAAVLIKDRQLRGPGFDYATHRDRMNRSLEELRLYDSRPVARAVAGVIRFNLNHFDGPASGVPEVDACAASLRAIRAGEFRLAPPATVEEGGTLAVDEATHLLLRAHRDLRDGERRRAATTALLQMAGSATTAPADAVKARALGLAAVGDSPRDDARRAAEALRNDAAFGTMATDWLERR